MLATLVLASSLAAASPDALPSIAAAPPAALAVLALPAPRPARLRLQQQDGVADDWEQEPQDDEGERQPHVFLSGWAGEGFERGGSGRATSFYAAEVAWAFSSLDLGVQGAWYRSLSDATRSWTPVVITRLTQRFKTRRGFEAAFSVGFGAGKPHGWIGWYQVALGLRVPFGPLFVAGEIGFEQYDIIRLGGGLGLAF